MLRPNRKYLVAGLVAAALIAVSAPQAQAFWGCGWGGSCYTPCYSSCYSSCYTPCYSSCYSSCDPCSSWTLGYRRGPIRRAVFGPYKWYNSGYYGVCGGCGVCGDCCSWDTCGSICTPTGCGDNCQPGDAAPSMDTPTTAPPKSETKLPASTQINTRENSGLLTIWVPAKAKVFINGLETTTTGTRRRYVSHGLQPGLTYKYVIRAEIVRNGKIATETKTVNLAASGTEGVAFGFNIGLERQFAAAQR